MKRKKGSLIKKEAREKFLYIDFVEITDVQNDKFILKGSSRLLLTSFSIWVLLLKSIKEFCVFTVK